MTAAVITPSGVFQTDEMFTNILAGTLKRRIRELYLVGTKAAQNDWFLLSDYIPAAACDQVIEVRAIVDNSGAVAVDTVTYTNTETAANAKIVVAGSTTGVSHVWVRYYTV